MLKINYMLNGWTELQNYRMDGHYTIDNMIAERVIRPFAVIETERCMVLKLETIWYMYSVKSWMEIKTVQHTLLRRF